MLWGYLPPSDAVGHILVTSQAGASSLACVGIDHTHTLEPLATDAAVALLWSSVQQGRATFVSVADTIRDLHAQPSGTAEEGGAATIVEWVCGTKGVQGHPVALGIIAGYVGTSPGKGALAELRHVLTEHHPSLMRSEGLEHDAELLQELLASADAAPLGDCTPLLAKLGITAPADLLRVSESNLLDAGWAEGRRAALARLLERLPEFLVAGTQQRNIIRAVWRIAVEDLRVRLPAGVGLLQAAALLGQGAPVPEDLAVALAMDAGLLPLLRDLRVAAVLPSPPRGGDGDTSARATPGEAMGGLVDVQVNVDTALTALARAGLVTRLGGGGRGGRAFTFVPGLQAVVRRSVRRRWPSQQWQQVAARLVVCAAAQLPELRSEEDLAGEWRETSPWTAHLPALCGLAVDGFIDDVTPESARREAALCMAKVLLIAGAADSLAEATANEAYLTRARALLRDYAPRGEDDLQLGFVHTALRRKAAARGDYVEAFRCAKRALAVFTAALPGRGDAEGSDDALAAGSRELATHVSHYGAALSMAGQVRRGYDEALRGLAMHEAAPADGPPPEVPALLRIAGTCAVASGHLQAGTAYLRRAVDAARPCTLEHCRCATALADAMLLQGRTNPARRLLAGLVSAWHSVFDAVGDLQQWEAVTGADQTMFSHAAAVCGTMHLQRGQPQLAAPFLRQAVALDAGPRPLFFQAEAHAQLAQLARLRSAATEGGAAAAPVAEDEGSGDAAALAQCRVAVAQAGDCTLFPLHACRALVAAGNVYHAMSGPHAAAAEACFTAAVRSLESTSSQPKGHAHPLLGEALLRLAHIYRADGRRPEAVRTYRQARDALHATLPPAHPLVQETQPPALATDP